MWDFEKFRGSGEGEGDLGREGGILWVPRKNFEKATQKSDSKMWDIE